MGHSPMPWRIYQGFLVDAEERPLADLGYFHMPEDKANAALIVRAVNSHAALVKALERAREAVNAIVLSTNSVSFRADLNAIDAALASAAHDTKQQDADPNI